LATVHGNSQMAGLLLGQGHDVVKDDDSVIKTLEEMMYRWISLGLQDNGQVSPYTTQAAVQHLRESLL